MLKFLLPCQGDPEIRQGKLFAPKDMGSIGVSPDLSIGIHKLKYTVLVTSWEHVADSSQEKAVVDCPLGSFA